MAMVLWEIRRDPALASGPRQSHNPRKERDMNSNKPIRMGRKAFNSFVYDLYGCIAKNDVQADVSWTALNGLPVETFHSPAGTLVATWESVDFVSVVAPVEAIEAVQLRRGVAFVAMTHDDEAHVRRG
jgi:hypothetical protein